MTPEFLPTFKKSITWQDLSTDEQDQFGKAYLENQNYSQEARQSLLTLMTEGSMETLNSEKGGSINDSEKLSIRNQEASYKTVN